MILYIAGVFLGIAIMSAIWALFIYQMEIETTTDPRFCRDKSIDFYRDASE